MACMSFIVLHNIYLSIYIQYIHINYVVLFKHVQTYISGSMSHHIPAAHAAGPSTRVCTSMIVSNVGILPSGYLT